MHELVPRNVQAGKLKALLNSVEPLTNKDIFIISVQTPIEMDKKPNLTFLMKAIEDVRESMRKGTIVVVSSALPPRALDQNWNQ